MSDFLSFTLKDGRLMEYKECGDLDSKTVVVWFHGLGAVADTGKDELFKKLKVHCIAPNLPGFVRSSNWPKGKPHKEYANDVLELLNFKFQDLKPLKIYAFGGSYGTVFAQICTGNLDCFNGMLILGAFSPFHLHKNYAKGMTWMNWISVGPLGYYFPIISKTIACILQNKLATPEGAASVMSTVLKLSPLEVQHAKEWSIKTGKTMEERKLKMAGDMMLSMKYSTDGFVQGPQFIHADWGFHPKEISHKKILIGGARNDMGAHYPMQVWLADQYEAELKTIEGGHFSFVFILDSVLEEYFADFINK